MEHALAAQARSCETVGSFLYANLLRGLVDDHRRGGLTAELLDGVSERPVHDAVPLRYLATGHRLALTGGARGLAALYPSCGGTWRGDRDGAAVTAEFLSTVAAQREEFEAGLLRNVQTNEVGRAPVLASGMAWISAGYGLPIDQIEIGSSAGLLSRWDHYGFDTGASRCGDSNSSVQFGPTWWRASPPDLLPDLSNGPLVARRRASDISPIDVSTDHGRAALLSFVWPDQLDRIARLHAAIMVARTIPVLVEAQDAGVWLARQLRDGTATGAVTVVFHSIVWQYLPADTRDAVRGALSEAGATATTDRPLCWLRMEPATLEHADLRVTTWPGGEERHLADVGYHGADVRWRAGA